MQLFEENAAAQWQSRCRFQFVAMMTIAFSEVKIAFIIARKEII